MTINRGTSRLFSAIKNSSIRLFRTYSKLPTPPNYPYLAIKRISQKHPKVKKIKMHAGMPNLRFSLNTIAETYFTLAPFHPSLLIQNSLISCNESGFLVNAIRKAKYKTKTCKTGVFFFKNHFYFS